MVASDKCAADEESDGGAPASGWGLPSTLTLTLSLEAFQALHAHLQSGAARGLAFEQPLREALCVSRAGGPRGPERGSPCPLSLRTLRKVRDFIQANLAREFGIDDIARAAFLSPYHLGRAWHRATGISLWQYVLQSRAQLACSLIESQPEQTLSEVAAQSGFESYSQFIAVFRRSYGRTPSSYRRECRDAAQ
jgi:AraC-like DNA-binding protein